MAGAQLQRQVRPGATSDDLETTKTLWLTTCLSASQIGLSFTPPVTRNVILGRIKKLKLIGAARPPKPYNVVKLPPPEERPKAKPRAEREPDPPKIPAPAVDMTPAALLARFTRPTATMRPWEERGAGQCAYPIDVEGKVFSCCGPVARGRYCAPHARTCYEAPRT